MNTRPKSSAVPDPSQGRINITDALLREGFTQVPNLLLRAPDVDLGTRMTFAMVLSYAWQEGGAFPGQIRLSRDLGMSLRWTQERLYDLQRRNILFHTQPGFGEPNIYTVGPVGEWILTALPKRTAHNNLQALPPSEGGQIRPLPPSGRQKVGESGDPPKLSDTSDMQAFACLDTQAFACLDMQAFACHSLPNTHNAIHTSKTQGGTASEDCSDVERSSAEQPPLARPQEPTSKELHQMLRAMAPACGRLCDRCGWKTLAPDVSERWSRILYPRLRDEHGTVLPKHLQVRFVDWFLSNGYFLHHKERITGQLGPEAELWVQDGYPDSKDEVDGSVDDASDYAPALAGPTELTDAERHPVWGPIIAEVRLVITSANYEQWLANTVVLEATPEGEHPQLVIQAASEFGRMWLETKLRAKIERAAERLSATPPTIVFVAPVTAS